jgi:hypothetical protein
MAELDFEEMLMQYFGDKAWHTAASAYSKTTRNKWLKKLESKLIADIDTLDTSERHKSLMMRDAESFFKTLRADEPSWDSIFAALMFISRFLGYDYCRGSKQHTLTYYQTEAQYYTQKIFAGGDPMQDHFDRKDVISQRAEIAKSLKENGHNTLRIAQILNISEYKVKQLLKT